MSIVIGILGPFFSSGGRGTQYYAEMICIHSTSSTYIT